MEERFILQPKQEEKKMATPKITLRPFELSDADDLMTWASDDRVMRFLPRSPYTSKEEALDYIKNHIMPHPWYRAISIGNRPIGAISVNPVPDGDKHRMSMGYGLSYEHWGQGITTVAVKKVLSTVFEEMPHLERLEALVDVENPGSQRVLEKAGFKREGVLRKYLVIKGKARDMVMYSFLSSDPHVVR